MAKRDVVYIYCGIMWYRILLRPKKEKRKFAICKNMDGLRGYFAKGNNLEKGKYYMALI